MINFLNKIDKEIIETNMKITVQPKNFLLLK